jgi:hypothetical protein
MSNIIQPNSIPSADGLAQNPMLPAGMGSLKVLVACEYSGVVRDAFKALGHDATSCDLLPTDKLGQHYQGNVFDIINDGWDLMIAHPPCTFLSRAGTRWLFPKGILNKERFNKGMEARKFFEQLLNAPIPMIAIENPVPHKVFGMPEPTQIIQPWQHGHEAQKTTLLWLKNLPLIKETNVVGKGEYFYDKVNGWRHTKWFMSNTCQKARSKTFEGIAAAFAMQWGGNACR